MPRRNNRPDNVGLSIETLPGLNIDPTLVGLGARGKPAPRVVEKLTDRPAWTAYHGARRPCDQGVRIIHEGGRGHRTPARYKRRFLVGGIVEEHLLCQPCAMTQHAADGLTSPLPSTMRR
jgi:hypothetical protein